MVTINDFTNEEKILYSGIIWRIHKNTSKTNVQLIRALFDLQAECAVDFSKQCTNLLIEAGIAPGIAENTPLSKYVWKNMEKEKQAYILRKIQEIKKGVDSALDLIVMVNIRDILDELEIRPYSYEGKTYHFPAYGAD